MLLLITIPDRGTRAAMSVVSHLNYGSVSSGFGGSSLSFQSSNLSPGFSISSNPFYSNPISTISLSSNSNPSNAFQSNLLPSNSFQSIPLFRNMLQSNPSSSISNTFESNSYSSNTFQSDHLYSSNRIHSNSFPSNSYSSNRINSNSFPSNTFESNPFPSNRFQSNSFRSNTFQPDPFPILSSRQTQHNLTLIPRTTQKPSTSDDENDTDLVSSISPVQTPLPNSNSQRNKQPIEKHPNPPILQRMVNRNQSRTSITPHRMCDITILDNICVRYKCHQRSNEIIQSCLATISKNHTCHGDIASTCRIGCNHTLFYVSLCKHSSTAMHTSMNIFYLFLLSLLIAIYK